MAGAGVSVGGAGMLRARRRDVSVKPNRKLDRKSSRGMIYENEELRLRTIHINAEVEQGQNDIKKLRRENEQLRREIWSLRDEYDKLEEILKNQNSEEYEDRSETEDKEDEEAEDCSDYSDEENEETEEYCNEEEKDVVAINKKESDTENNQEERLENAENQKISSEKMSSSNHRLHVEFDDLSVVDEEEELKKDKERKEIVSPEEKESRKAIADVASIRTNRRNGYQCFPSHYSSSGTSGSANPYYQSDCPFVFPNADGTKFTNMLPIDGSPMLLTTCPGVYGNSFPPITNFESPGVRNVSPTYDETLRHDPMTYRTQVGWQNNIFPPSMAFSMSDRYKTDLMAAQASGMCPSPIFNSPGVSEHSAKSPSTGRTTSMARRTPIDDSIESSGTHNHSSEENRSFPRCLSRRNVFPQTPMSFHQETIIPSCTGATGFEVPISTETLTRDGWDFDNAKILRDVDSHKSMKNERQECGEIVESDRMAEGQKRLEDVTCTVGSDRPKHFFAPLPTKIQHGRQDSGDKMTQRTGNPQDSPCTTFFEIFGTGKSSGSDRTNSTVISARHFQPYEQPVTLAEFFTENGEKGSADICVNGAVATYANAQSHYRGNEDRGYKSSDNLLVGETNVSRGNSSSRQSANNPIVKSVSCHDLSAELLQNSFFDVTKSFQADVRAQKLAKSDNTLDNRVIGSSKPFRSQLNVTLRVPNGGVNDNSNEPRICTPETPEIPQLPAIDYRLFSNPFLKTFDARGRIYGNYEAASPVTRPLSIQVNDANVLDRGGKILQREQQQQQQPSIDYSSAVLTQSFARRLNPEENTAKSTRTYGGNEIECDRRRVSMSSTTNQQVPAIDPRIIASPKQRPEFQVTSFEAPNPRSLHPGYSAYYLDPLRRLPATSPTATTNLLIPTHPKLYQNVPFVPGTPGMYCSPTQNSMRMFYENQTTKVPAQTQTSIDGGSCHGNENPEAGVDKNTNEQDKENPSVPGSPTAARRKRPVRKERSDQKPDKRPLSPAAQRRRLRKQASVEKNGNVATGQNKVAGKSRQLSPATTTPTSENIEEKNESRSSSSGQDSPKKESRRVSKYFNSKKRSSLSSVKTTRSSSIDNAKDSFGHRSLIGDTLETTNSERERTNSASSREAAPGGKTRKSSVSSGKVPWCACWGNGCV